MKKAGYRPGTKAWAVAHMARCKRRDREFEEKAERLAAWGRLRRRPKKR